MNSHGWFITAAYLVSALGIIGLIVWLVLDWRTQRRAIADLEASGIRRRSDRAA